MTETEKKKTKTNQLMNNVIQLEDRVSRSRSKHEGESSADICDRLSRTRVSSQRQLPTDLDYAVSTREYQLDQSSPLPASAAADPVPDRKKRPTHLDRSLHIREEWPTSRPERAILAGTFQGRLAQMRCNQAR